MSRWLAGRGRGQDGSGAASDAAGSGVAEVSAAAGGVAAGSAAAGSAAAGSAGASSAAGHGAAGGPAAPGGAARSGRRRPWRAAFFAVAAIAIVIGVGWALLDSKFFVVRSVTVTGTQLTTPAQVRSAASIQPGIPLIRVNTAAVARRVEQIRQVESARVTRQWPNGVAIAVTERTPVLAVPVGTGYQMIDKYGVAVQTLPEPPPGLPTLDFAGPVSSLRGSRADYAAAVVLTELPRPLVSPVATVQAPSASAITVTLANGVTIVWGGTGRAAAKATELTLLMRTHARSYDVSAPETAVSSG